MTIQGYREIVGPRAFERMVTAMTRRFEHGNISTADFVDLAVASSGLPLRQRPLLRDYFDQWLYGDVQPTILPASFEP